jgi:hypothetical protein
MIGTAALTAALNASNMFLNEIALCQLYRSTVTRRRRWHPSDACQRTAASLPKRLDRHCLDVIDLPTVHGISLSLLNRKAGVDYFSGGRVCEVAGFGAVRVCPLNCDAQRGIDE